MIIIFIVDFASVYTKNFNCQFNSELLKRNIITYNVTLKLLFISFQYFSWSLPLIIEEVFRLSIKHFVRFPSTINLDIAQDFYDYTTNQINLYTALFIMFALPQCSLLCCDLAILRAMRRFSSINVIRIAFIISIILDATKLYPSPSFLALFSNYKRQETLEIRGISNTSFFPLIQHSWNFDR